MFYDTTVLRKTKDWQDVSVKFSGHEIIVREFISGRNAIKSYRGAGITWKDIQTFTKNFTLERQQVADCCGRWYNNQIFIEEIELANGKKYGNNQEGDPSSFDLTFCYFDGHCNLMSAEPPSYFELPIPILNQVFQIAEDFHHRFTPDDMESHRYSEWKTSEDSPQMGEPLNNYLKRTIGEEMAEMVSFRTEKWNGFHERWGKIEEFLYKSFLLQPAELFLGNQGKKSIRIIGIQSQQDTVYALDDDCEWHLIPSWEKVDLYIKFIDLETHVEIKKEFMRAWNKEHRSSPDIVCVDKGFMILHLAFDLRSDTSFESVCGNFLGNYSKSLPRSLNEFINLQK